MSIFDLTGKKAIVTGGSRGLGHGMAEGLLEAGCEVVIIGTRETIKDRADEFNQKGFKCTGVQADLGDEIALKEAFQESLAALGGHLDILVNNAGITRDNLIMKMSEEDFDAVINANLKGCFNTIKAVSRQMLRQRSGRIINITSVSGILGNAGQANYSASKAGIIGMTKSAARELASRGITVNAVAPGFVNTEMTEVLSDSVKEAATAQIPLKTFGETKDIAYAVAFLASDEARYITGQVLCVDGGMAM